MNKVRIDILMVERGLSESRSKAQRQVMAGEVRVKGLPVYKASQKFHPQVEITLIKKPRFVSRGGLKLIHALEEFSIDCTGKTCVDIGTSTGGFTDCLLQHGAAKVYAIDVGYGQLHQKLRDDSRVINMERTNIKSVQGFNEPINLITVDVSFISLQKILGIIIHWDVPNGGELVTLIKPQFEVGRKIAAKGKGVIRDENERQQAVDKIIGVAQTYHMDLLGLTQSPIIGPKGNIEYLAYFSLQ